MNNKMSDLTQDRANHAKYKTLFPNGYPMLDRAYEEIDRLKLLAPPSFVGGYDKTADPQSMHYKGKRFDD